MDKQKRKEVKVNKTEIWILVGVLIFLLYGKYENGLKYGMDLYASRIVLLIVALIGAVIYLVKTYKNEKEDQDQEQNPEQEQDQEQDQEYSVLTINEILKMNKHILILPIIPIIMLLWALNPSNPYAYYKLLRWVCCGIFAYLAFQSFDRKKQGWVWLLGITALLYNPIFPVHLNRAIWSDVNIVTVIILITFIVSEYKNLKQKSGGQVPHV